MINSIIAEEDNIMKKIISQVGECTIGKNRQPIYTYLIGIIVGQKIRFSEAKKIRAKLYIETNSYEYTSQNIIDLTEEQWNKINVGNEVKNKILNVTKYFVENKDVKNDKTFILNLEKIKGIGSWTVQTLLIEYGLDYDLFPLNDKHVNKQIKNLYNVEEKNIDDFVKKWTPCRSIAFWYLWKYNLEK